MIANAFKFFGAPEVADTDDEVDNAKKNNPENAHIDFGHLH